MQKLQNGTDLFLSLKLSGENGVEVTGFIPHIAHANFLLTGMPVFIRITIYTILTSVVISFYFWKFPL